MGFRLWILAVVLLLAVPETALAACGCSGGTIDSDGTGPCLITQAPHDRDEFDITWRFDAGESLVCAELYPADGMGINWAVESDAELTSIEPVPTGDFSGAPACSPNGCGTFRHGAVFNPVHQEQQTFDSRLGKDYPNLNVDFPFQPNIDGTVIKAVSKTDLVERVYLSFVAALTFFDSMPSSPDEVFRPAYYGTTKTVHRITDVDVSWLPRLETSSVPLALTPTEAAECLKWMQIDHLLQNEATSRRHHAEMNYGVCMSEPYEQGDGYGAEIISFQDDGWIPIFLDYDLADKLPAVYNLVQLGIDNSRIIEVGGYWPPDGGHYPGRRFPVAFAGIALDNSAIKTAAGDSSYAEIGHYYLSVGNDRVMFGRNVGVSGFWSWTCDATGAKDARDPFGLIDTTNSYTKINAANGQRSQVVASLLVPGLDELYANDHWQTWIIQYKTDGRWIPDGPAGGTCTQCGSEGDSGCIVDGSCTCTVTGAPYIPDKSHMRNGAASWHGNTSVTNYGTMDGNEFFNAFLDCAQAENCEDLGAGGTGASFFGVGNTGVPLNE